MSIAINWETRVEEVPMEKGEIEKVCNRLGKQGWEPTAPLLVQRGCLILFKRPKIVAPKKEPWPPHPKYVPKKRRTRIGNRKPVQTSYPPASRRTPTDGVASNPNKLPPGEPPFEGGDCDC